MARCLRTLSAAMPYVNVTDDVREMWASLFEDTPAGNLHAAVVWYIADLKKPHWPVPSEMTRYLEKVRGHQMKQEMKDNVCDKCDDGFIEKDVERRGNTYRARVPCTCALGRARQAFLERR